MQKELSSGYSMPVIGLGTWTLKDRTKLLNALECAYNAGYRHVDTAAIYENESVVGEFLRTKDRKSIFVTTKLWNTDHERVQEACEESLQRLGVDYLDLYLIHWPVFFGSTFDVHKVWTAMEELVYAGKVRSIGVSNFGVKNLKKILSFCRIKPAVDQVELHPYLPQHDIRQLCTENNIVVISYSSLGSSGENISLRNDPVVRRIAAAHSATPEKVLLSYCVCIGCCVIPRSCSEAHIIDNFSLVELSEDDLKELEGIQTRFRYVEIDSFGPNRFD